MDAASVLELRHDCRASPLGFTHRSHDCELGHNILDQLHNTWHSECASRKPVTARAGFWPNPDLPWCKHVSGINTR
eukprot:2944908-Amphidinium_carterae.1